jgi:hypothetical protein
VVFGARAGRAGHETALQIMGGTHRGACALAEAASEHVVEGLGFWIARVPCPITVAVGLIAVGDRGAVVRAVWGAVAVTIGAGVGDSSVWNMGIRDVSIWGRGIWDGGVQDGGIRGPRVLHDRVPRGGAVVAASQRANQREHE